MVCAMVEIEPQCIVWRVQKNEAFAHSVTVMQRDAFQVHCYYQCTSSLKSMFYTNDMQNSKQVQVQSLMKYIILDSDY